MELVAIGNRGLGCCIDKVEETQDFLAEHFGIAVHVDYDGSLLAVLEGVPERADLGLRIILKQGGSFG